MKKVFKILGLLLLAIIVIAGGLIAYVKAALPNVGPAPTLTVERTPERIERGRYLANNICVCVDCHSTRDWSKFSGPIKPGTLGMGGETFDQRFGFPGKFYSRNITPEGISRYSDGELFRLITTGVTKEGKAIFPVMPYAHYGKMDPEDIKCVIAYLRTLPAVHNEVPASVADFPMNIILNTIPAKAEPQTRPNPAETVKYGAYLVNACGCIECHTKADHGQIIPKLAFSGGREFPLPDGSVVRSSNITPDKNTGIGNWNQDAFVNRFKAYADSSYQPPAVTAGSFNSIMPWTMYSHMTREDLAAVYAYLQTLSAMDNQVVKFSPAKR